MAKRIFDVLVSGTLLLLISPVLAAIALAIYLHDRGPVFFRQTRIGLGGTPFPILKFRSMVLNADKIGSYSTADNDPRITRIGRMLRRTSLDELPQLINVLRGEMSLVGPRPDVPAQSGLYSPDEFAKRHSVRPGITGLAQARLRSAATQQQRTALDLEYVGRASLLFDLKIMLWTVQQVLFKGGN